MRSELLGGLEGGLGSRLLLLVAGRAGSQTAELRAGQELTLGRAAPADLRIEDAKLSRLHARFVRDGDAVRVSDLGSRNGTFVRGVRVDAAVLRAGDQAVLGDVTVSVEALAAPPLARLGLSTYEAVLSWLRQEWQRAQRFGRPFAVAMLRCLRIGSADRRALAAACMAQLRPADRIALYGEDTLLVLLPEATSESALRVARALSVMESKLGPVGCAIAPYPAAASCPEELVSAAWLASRRLSADEPVLVAPSVSPLEAGKSPWAERVDLRAEVNAYEAELIRNALLATGGHQRRAAQRLNLPLRTLERKLKHLGIRAASE